MGIKQEVEMALDSNGGSEDGIQLALDPNLISLPLHGSTASPLGATANENSFDQQSPPQALEGKPDDIQEPGLLSKSSRGATLIDNPYELYGQMPMGELIPLILQQRGPGSKFADLSEEVLLQEIEDEDNTQLEKSRANQGTRVDDSHIDPSGVDTDEVMDLDYEKRVSGEQDDQFHAAQSSQLGKDDFGCFASEDGDNAITQEKFLKIRKEMIEHINLAMNESSLALEFLSLLLSSVKKSTALTSMSPFLKKTVSVGSLNSDKLPREPISKDELLDSEILNRGWKLRSLNESRSILKDSFRNLELVMSREHAYWSKISKYVSNKDVIFKMRDKSTGLRSLGIKYGYEDSGSTYRRDKGVAVLRNNLEQNLLELIPSSTMENPMSRSNEKFIRLRIFTKIESEDDYILTGESSLDSLFVNGSTIKKDQDDIRGQIKRLKAFIFEQELMHQLKKECSLLISYGVTIENENKVVMELPNEKIEMELLSIEDTSVVNHIQDAPKVNDRRATLALTTLRMLLIVMFKKNLRKKLTSTRNSNGLNIEKDILLIRPLLGKMRHQNYKILLRKIVKDYVLDIVEDSKLTETSLFKNSNTEKVADAHVAKLTREIKSFASLLDTSKTKFEITIPEKGELILVLSSPNYCNAVVSVNYEEKANSISFDTKFSEFKEIEEFLNFLVTEYVKGKDIPIKKEE